MQLLCPECNKEFSNEYSVQNLAESKYFMYCMSGVNQCKFYYYSNDGCHITGLRIRVATLARYIVLYKDNYIYVNRAIDGEIISTFLFEKKFQSSDLKLAYDTIKQLSLNRIELIESLG